MKASVIGAGLAGCEAAYQLAKRGIEVDLYEMKPKRRSPAHNADTLAELVCSNSLRSDQAAKRRRSYEGRNAPPGFADNELCGFLPGSRRRRTGS